MNKKVNLIFLILTIFLISCASKDSQKEEQSNINLETNKEEIKQKKEITKTLNSKEISSVLKSDQYLYQGFLAKNNQLMQYVEIKRGIVYKTIKDEEIVLDLYRPKNNQEKLPTIIYIHGGGWEGGNHEDCPAEKIVVHDYAVACIQYRLSGKAKFPAQIIDIKEAVRWLKLQAREYNLDPNNFAAWGESAGAHLASLLGTSTGIKEIEGNNYLSVSSNIKAVVDWFGPVDYQILEEKQDTPMAIAFRKLIGIKNIQEESNFLKKIKLASPTSHLDQNDPSFLIFHGKKDNVVPVAQSKYFHQQLQNKNIPSQLITRNNANHFKGFTNKDIEEQAIPFLNKHLK